MQIWFLEGGAISSIRSWRGDFASVSQTEVAHRLRPARPPALNGAPLPPGASSVSLAVTTDGRPVNLALAIETPGGDFDNVPLGDTFAMRISARTVQQGDGYWRSRLLPGETIGERDILTGRRRVRRRH